MKQRYMPDRKPGVIRTSGLTYKSYASMMSRCYTPSYTNFHLWGGRGIKVCEEWRVDNGFNNFVSDMGERPSKLHSLDRIDTDGDYTPENCRWATRKEQNRNRRDNSIVDYFGEKYVLADLAERLGVGYGTLWYRVRHGVPQDKWGSLDSIIKSKSGHTGVYLVNGKYWTACFERGGEKVCRNFPNKQDAVEWRANMEKDFDDKLVEDA